MADVPQLQPLIQRFGAEEVWQAGLDVLGWPIAWQPSTGDLLRVKERLECQAK